MEPLKEFGLVEKGDRNGFLGWEGKDRCDGAEEIWSASGEGVVFRGVLGPVLE